KRAECPRYPSGVWSWSVRLPARLGDLAASPATRLDLLGHGARVDVLRLALEVAELVEPEQHQADLGDRLCVLLLADAPLDRLDVVDCWLVRLYWGHVHLVTFFLVVSAACAPKLVRLG